MKPMIFKRTTSPLYFLPLGLVIVLSGCSYHKQITPLFKSQESLTRAEIIKQLQCNDAKDNTADSLLPVALYQQMNQCAEQGNYRSATLLFSLAGTYTWYDASRIDTDSARNKHAQLLGEALGRLAPERREYLWRNIQSVLGDRQQLDTVCQMVRLIGPPAYQPDYMAGGEGKMMPDFSALPRWDGALQNYLHCPID
ncbi:hypothetical protein YEEN111655_09330 [Yersinia entomophaga]